jgi:hypothetical protein
MAYAGYYRACVAGDVGQILASIASGNRREFESYNKDMREMVIAVLKARPAKIKIGNPSISGDKASFSVEGLDNAGQKAIGSIKMVMEEGKWKVSEDKWSITQE